MHLENNVSFSDLGIRPTPGTMAALFGYWKGRNRADNEELRNARGSNSTAGGASPTATSEGEYRQKVKQRYSGTD